MPRASKKPGGFGTSRHVNKLAATPKSLRELRKLGLGVVLFKERTGVHGGYFYEWTRADGVTVLRGQMHTSRKSDADRIARCAITAWLRDHAIA
jgi:hypothetical protein